MRVNSFPSALKVDVGSSYEAITVFRVVSPSLRIGLSRVPSANSSRRTLVSSVSIPVTVVLLIALSSTMVFKSGGNGVSPGAPLKWNPHPATRKNADNDNPSPMLPHLFLMQGDPVIM